MEVESCEEIQRNERTALESIYGDDITFAKNIWGVWQPLSVTISLRPIESASKGNSFASLEMHIQCTANYPKEIPTIALRKEKGISKVDLEKLHNMLLRKANELKEERLPMIMELCDEVRQFLYEHNKPPTGSFHDGMLREHARDMSEQKRQRLNSEQKELQAAEVEKERRHLEAEWKREEMRERQRTTSVAEHDIRLIGPFPVGEMEGSPIAHKRNVHPICKEWTGTYQSETVIISEWVFEHTLGRKGQHRVMPDFGTFISRLADFESTFPPLSQLADVDASIVPYVFVHIDRVAITSSHFHIRIYVAHSIASADKNLSVLVDKIAEDAGALRRLATSCVCGLRWLHDQQLSHASLNISSIWTEDCTAFRMSDWQIGKALYNLAEIFRSIIGDMNVATSPPPDEKEKGQRRKDLFSLGTLLDSIRNRSLPSEDSSISESPLDDFISDCQTVKSIEELIDHKYLAADVYVPEDISGRKLCESNGARTRLGSEFYIIKSLGRGGFGEVLLARNKIDLIHYAVKMIPLDPKSERLNRKMNREAKLFAKLNHPNVVRYYSAWIDNTGNSRSPMGSAKKKNKSKDVRTSNNTPISSEDSLMPTRLRNLDAHGKSTRGHETSEWTAEWTTSFREPRVDVDEESSSCSPAVHTLFAPGADGDDFEILFEGSGAGDAGDIGVTSDEVSSASSFSETNSSVPTTTTKDTKETQDTSTSAVPTRMLYIQMEYCAKGTLRNFIDSRTLLNNSRLTWQIFTEILSGLAYIHSQGMIHRDIKPMNILLDGKNHVKIGDFGLATRELLFRKDANIAGNENKIGPSGDASLTMDIGTELYMAPELLNPTGQPYTAKIDVYSTGIVLFEMFYRPLPPGMERISTIKTLKSDGKVPNDFISALPTVQGGAARRLIEWMVSPNPLDRPSTHSLLSEDHLPITEVDDDSFQKLFLKTLRKRVGRLFDWTMDRIMTENTQPSQTYLYDTGICHEKFVGLDRESTMWSIWVEMEKCLRVRAFTPLQTHLLAPTQSVSNVSPLTRKPYVMVDRSAMPVALPVDLRQNFVRFCSRNAVNRLKRFALGRVYCTKENIGGQHPMERWELSIDGICPVASIGSLKTQIISCAVAIAKIGLPGSKLTMRIGHMSLVQAVLDHLNIVGESRERILDSLHEISTNSKNLSLMDRLEILSEVCGSKTATVLLSQLPTENTVNLFREECRAVVRSRDDNVRDKARSAIVDIEKAIEAVQGEEVAFELCASLVYRPRTFKNGLLFQICVTMPGKKGNKVVPIISGGRYESLLASSRHATDSVPHSSLAMFGCAVNMDGVAQFAVQEGRVPASCTAMVCSYGRPLIAEKMDLCRSLWKRNVSTDMLNDPLESQTLEEIILHCENTKIQHLLVMFDADQVLVRSQRIDHGKVDCETALDIVMALETQSNTDAPRTHVLTPSRSATHGTTNAASSSSAFVNVNVSWAVPEKPAYPTRKRMENTCCNVLSEPLSKLGKVRVEIVLTDLHTDIMASAASRLELGMSSSELASLFDPIMKHHGKFKKELECLYDVLSSLIAPKSGLPPAVIILYTTHNNFYRLLI